MKMTVKIRKLLKQGKTAKEIAAKLKIPAGRVYTVRWLDSKKKATPERSSDPKVWAAEKKYIQKVGTVYNGKRWRIRAAVNDLKTTLDTLEKKKAQSDLVNSPPHYKSGGIETIDFIESKDLNYRLGNVVKYVSRAGKKDSDPLVDLKKARWYLDREIFAREGA